MKGRLAHGVLAGLLLCLLPLLARADEYGRGWCDAYQLGIKRSHQNRDHWRRLLGAPKKSNTEVIDEIYKTPWEGPLAPRRIGQPPGVPQPGPSLVDSVDLFVVFPAFREGKIMLPDESMVDCPSGDRIPKRE